MNDNNDPNQFDPQDELAIDRATGDEPREGGLSSAQRDDAETAAAALQTGLAPKSEMPGDLRDRLLADGLALVGARNPIMEQAGAPAPRSRWTPVLLAASLLLAAGVAVTGYLAITNQRQLESERLLVADLRERVESNRTLLAAAESRNDELLAEFEALDATATEQERELLEARMLQANLERENTRFAQQLADATSDLDRLEGDLDRARLEIAKFEAPPDPEALSRNRLAMLEMPATFVAQMSTFDLPDVPDLPAAEQRDVTGDFVWNEEVGAGYARFVGLDPNDPNIEQYQVWVIDERGLEQKVSGGVFNVNEEGEVIVPITPGIDVGRIALFAVTVEAPGGTWVPSLERRIVVAPRTDG